MSGAWTSWKEKTERPYLGHFPIKQSLELVWDSAGQPSEEGWIPWTLGGSFRLVEFCWKSRVMTASAPASRVHGQRDREWGFNDCNYYSSCFAVPPKINVAFLCSSSLGVSVKSASRPEEQAAGRECSPPTPSGRFLGSRGRAPEWRAVSAGSVHGLCSWSPGFSWCSAPGGKSFCLWVWGLSSYTTQCGYWNSKAGVSPFVMSCISPVACTYDLSSALVS